MGDMTHRQSQRARAGRARGEGDGLAAAAVAAAIASSAAAPPSEAARQRASRCFNFSTYLLYALCGCNEFTISSPPLQLLPSHSHSVSPCLPSALSLSSPLILAVAWMGKLGVKRGDKGLCLSPSPPVPPAPATPRAASRKTSEGATAHTLDSLNTVAN